VVVVGSGVVVVVGSWIGGSVVEGGGGGSVVVVVGSWIGGSVVVGGGGGSVVVVGGSVVVVGSVVGGTVVGAVVGGTVVGATVVVVWGCSGCGGWEGCAAAAVPRKVPTTAISTRAHRWGRFRRGMRSPYSLPH
jgi:hypothetical protein